MKGLAACFFSFYLKLFMFCQPNNWVFDSFDFSIISLTCSHSIVLNFSIRQFSLLSSSSFQVLVFKRTVHERFGFFSFYLKLSMFCSSCWFILLNIVIGEKILVLHLSKSISLSPRIFNKMTICTAFSSVDFSDAIVKISHFYPFWPL